MIPMRSRLAPTLALAGGIGFACAWVLLSQATGHQCSWMAVLAALDAALLLRMARVPAGTARAAWGVLATLLTIALANWGIVAAELGKVTGLAPWTSLGRLGLEHGWLLARLANGAVDLAWLAAGIVVATVTCR